MCEFSPRNAESGGIAPADGADDYLILKRARIVLPFFPAALGLASRRYLPLRSLRSARRPVNLNRFVPALPATVKLPRTLT